MTPDVISGLVINLIHKGLERMAVKYNLDRDGIMLQVKFGESDEEVAYAIYDKDYKKVSDILFNDLLGVKFDITCKEQIATPYLLTFMKTVCRHECFEEDEFTAFIKQVQNPRDNKFILVGLMYKQSEFIKQFNIDYIFNLTK